MTPDIYRTIEAPAEGLYKDKGSRFLAFAYPLISDNQSNNLLVEDQVKIYVDALRAKYHDARHHCFVWRTGGVGEHNVEAMRLNDDGEPAGTAARPMMGQILSGNLTNLLIVVVRYFGGIKLGVPGLIAAYKQATADVLSNAVIVERAVCRRFEVEFSYVEMNAVMRVIKEMSPRVVHQMFDNKCFMELEIRESEAARFEDRLVKIESLTLNRKK